MASLSKAQAYGVFAGVLVAYTIQCELASYLNRVGYDKSFFLLYLTHSSYTFLGIFHYAALKLSGRPIEPLLQELKSTIKNQLDASATEHSAFPARRALQRLLAITILIALPAGLWYAAIPITSMTSLTALYNLNAFWAYILSIYYSRSERWELRSGVAVGIACFGVLVMTYGDSKEDSSAKEASSSHHLFGDLLGLCASIACGFYEVWYKKYIALPSASEAIPLEPSSSYSRVPLASRSGQVRTSSIDSDDSPPQKNDNSRDDDDDELDALEAELYADKVLEHPSSQSPSVPTYLFLLHANSITTLIGISTFFLLWIPIPILHWMDWERFELPPSGTAYLAVAGVCTGGVIFNAGFMILLAQWGAVVTSVGNLFTLILVAAADEFIALTNGYSALSVSTLAGSGFILASFALLMTGS